MKDYIRHTVAAALAEDVGDGDLTAELIDDSAVVDAEIVTREAMTIAGQPWVSEVMRQLDERISIDWQHEDGDVVEAKALVCTLHGPARPILTGERTALNFLQLLSATATTTAEYVAAIATTSCRILDTRKTIPGLRRAQKYAVRCGGGANHRIGLFDAILIKENHILSAGGIREAIAAARALHPSMPLEIEVESIAETQLALEAGAERLLLDNFSLAMLREAVAMNTASGEAQAELEASGNMTLQTVSEVAKTGVDYISVGALTKNVRAIDLSMRFGELRSGQ